MRREITFIKKRAEDYLNSNTFTYIKEVINGRENFYNGFVIKVYYDLLVFFDIKLKREFPIRYESIEVIEPSKKDIEIKTAWEIYQQNRKEAENGK